MDNKKVEVDLQFFINAVENNNGKWEDWENGDDIIEVYISTLCIEETDYIVTQKLSYIKNELNKIINNQKKLNKEKEFKPFSKLKLHSYHKVKYCKKNVSIDLGSEIRTYFNFSAYEVIREMYNKYLITTSDINDYNIEVFLIKNDLIIRKIRQEYNLNEVDMACIRKILENSIKDN